MPYRLENYQIDSSWPIYQQAIHYYEVCEKDRNFSKQTMIGKVNSINHFLRFSKIRSITDLTNDNIEEYVHSQTEAHLKPRTINNRTKHVLAMARYYRDIEDLDIPGLKDKKIQKQIEGPSDKRAFSRQTICDALKYADREAWLLIKIGFDCGMRIDEIRKMRLRDINGHQLLVHGKGRKKRFVILSDEVVMRLQDWIRREQITDYIWESNHAAHAGQPKSTASLRRAMRRPFTAAGVYHMNPHELRHSYASDLLNVGVSPRGIQHGLGHSDARTTEIYLHELDPGKEIREMYSLKYSAPTPELY